MTISTSGPPRKPPHLDPKVVGQHEPDVLPILGEPVPPGGRMLTIFERMELSDWGFRGAMNYRTNLRAQPLPGQPDLFALVRWKPNHAKCGGWHQEVLPWRLSWPPGVREQIERGTGSTWITATDLERDPMRQPGKPRPVPRKAKKKR